MRKRFFAYMIISITLMVICIYYVLCFLFTYVNSRKNWMEKVYLGMIIDYMGIKLGIPLVKIILRLLIKQTNSKIIVKIYSLWITIMAYMKPKRV